MLLAVIVRQKLKPHGVELDPKLKQKQDSMQKVRAQEKRPYTPPGQKSYGPLPKVPKIQSKGIDLKIKSSAKYTTTTASRDTTSTVTMTTSSTTRGHSGSGDPVVAVYGSDSVVGG